jgi:23S rRNA pseudouridine1911/1915/1917 synthase
LLEQVITLTVDSEGGGRLDRFVAAQRPDLSRTTVQRLIDDGFVTLNGSICKASDKVEPGDVIVVRIPPPVTTELIAENIPLSIVYEDNDLVVIDKPAGLVVHPAAGHDSGTLVNALLGHLPDLGSTGGGIGGEVRPGIVHRLDKDTSGLIVVAKNDRALQFLQEQFKSRTIKKMYLALVDGLVTPPEGIIDASIGRSKHDRKKMAVTHDGRSARTRYRVIQIYRDPDLSLIEAYPETGRTHQIRVHLAHIHHPVFGDPTYNGRNIVAGPGTAAQKSEVHRLLDLIPRQALHAKTIGFLHPATGQQLFFDSALPPDMEAVLAFLRGQKV